MFHMVAMIYLFIESEIDGKPANRSDYIAIKAAGNPGLCFRSSKIARLQMDGLWCADGKG